jgi:hypothetical protein
LLDEFQQVFGVAENVEVGFIILLDEKSEVSKENLFGVRYTNFLEPSFNYDGRVERLHCLERGPCNDEIAVVGENRNKVVDEIEKKGIECAESRGFVHFL